MDIRLTMEILEDDVTVLREMRETAEEKMRAKLPGICLRHGTDVSNGVVLTAWDEDTNRQEVVWTDQEAADARPAEFLAALRADGLEGVSP